MTGTAASPRGGLPSPGQPAQLFVQRGKQGGAAVVLYLKGRGGALAEADRRGGDVLLQVGDGIAVADQDRFPEPAVAARFDPCAGGGELGGRLGAARRRLRWLPLAAGLDLIDVT